MASPRSGRWNGRHTESRYVSGRIDARFDQDAGFAQYVIINLLEKVVEVYESPIVGSGRYASPLRLKGADQVSFVVSGARIEVEASKLLP